MIEFIKKAWENHRYEKYAYEIGAIEDKPRLFLVELIFVVWAILICKVKGHDIKCKGYCSPDSGVEHVYCTRCGWEHKITYY